jgi:hypothetical protein
MISQARGKYIMPAYKVVLFGGFASSMYMMGRLVLVRGSAWSGYHC